MFSKRTLIAFAVSALMFVVCGFSSAQAQNIAPVANAGSDQVSRLRTTVLLNGTASFDANGDLLTFSWALTSVPNRSKARLVGASTATPTFSPDKVGTYAATLTVQDPSGASSSDMVLIFAARR